MPSFFHTLMTDCQTGGFLHVKKKMNVNERMINGSIWLLKICEQILCQISINTHISTQLVHIKIEKVKAFDSCHNNWM